MYNNPLAIQARVPQDILGSGRSGDTEAFTTRPIHPNEITGVGSFAPTDVDPTQTYFWAKNYLQLQRQLGITPTPGSRGEAFQTDLERALSSARYGEHDGFGRPLLNKEEMENTVTDVVKKYSPNCPTCTEAK
jgi:hypothetical protein